MVPANVPAPGADVKRGEELDQRLYRIPEVATRLGLSRSAVYALVASGAIASVKIGRSRRVPASLLDRFVDELVSEQVGDANRDTRREARRRVDD